jgi:hypothetical protein
MPLDQTNISIMSDRVRPLGHQASEPTSAMQRLRKPSTPGKRAPLNADCMNVIVSFCDAETLVATLVHASKTMRSAVDAHAAARARRLWTTSAELERRGVRLGAAFLARRSRPPRKAADGSCIPLASRTLTAAEKEGADWDEYTRSELPLPGRVLIVDVIVRTAAAEHAGPSRHELPIVEDHANVVIDGTIVGRRSVILDAMPSDDAVHFAPLRIAEGLEPSSLWNDISAMGQDRPDHYWLAEVANVVGGHQFLCTPPTFSGDPSVGECTSVNHRFAADCLKHGIIDAYRPSQLPENHRYVSVRVDLFRLSDGRSMCLGEHDVGVKWTAEWPGEEWPDDESLYEEEHILLTPNECCLYEESILPQPLLKGDNDVLALRSCVRANYPQETPGALDLVAVSLGFSCPEQPGEDDGINAGEGNTFDGMGHTHDMVVKSLLTLDAWT